jgi:hypothetical protein
MKSHKNYLFLDQDMVNIFHKTVLGSRGPGFKLLPLQQPALRARTGAHTNPSAQRGTQLRSVLARVYAVSRQNQTTTTFQ